MTLRTHGSMTEKSMGWKTSCSSENKTSTNFLFFQGSLKRESDNSNFYLNMELATTLGGMTSQLQSTTTQNADYTTGITKGCHTEIAQ
jgi:hypothetical protein